MKKGKTLLLAVLIAAAILLGYLAYMSIYRKPRGLRPLLKEIRSGPRVGLTVAGLTGGDIPTRYTCGGEDVSPSVAWEPVEGAATYALVVYDPDAPKGIFIHWVIYNIPASVHGLPEAIQRAPLTAYGVQGLNSFGKLGYGGPCPPPGPRHHYHFLLLALDTRLDLEPGATTRQLLEAAEGHVVGYGEVVLTYGRG